MKRSSPLFMVMNTPSIRLMKRTSNRILLEEIRVSFLLQIFSLSMYSISYFLKEWMFFINQSL